MFLVFLALATPTIGHIVEVYRAFLSSIRMNNATFYQNRVRFAEKLGFTTATFDAHQIIRDGCYLFNCRHFGRLQVDSGDYVPYPELQQCRCSPYVAI